MDKKFILPTLLTLCLASASFAKVEPVFDEIGWVQGQCEAPHYSLPEQADASQRHWVQAILASLANRNPFGTYRFTMPNGTSWQGPTMENLLEEKNFLDWAGPALSKELGNHVKLIIEIEADKDEKRRSSYQKNYNRIQTQLEKQFRLKIEDQNEDCD